LGEEAVCWGQRAIQPYSWRPFLKTVPLILTGDVIKSAMAQQVITGTYIRAFSVEICDQDILPGKNFQLFKLETKLGNIIIDMEISPFSCKYV